MHVSLRCLSKDARPHYLDAPVICPRAKWNPALDAALKTTTIAARISSYPSYIKDHSERPPWRLVCLSLGNTFKTKQLRERYYEVVSDKIDKSEFTREEHEFILSEIPKQMSPKGCNWTKISFSLFSMQANPEALYRPSGFIKNRYIHLIKDSSDDAVIPKTRKRTPELVEPGPACPPPPIKKTSVTAPSEQPLQEDARPTLDSLSPSFPALTPLLDSQAPLFPLGDLDNVTPSFLAP